MATENLAEVINSLTPQQQDSVRQFVEYLKQREPSPFLAAIDDFIDQHPELLHRLAR